MAAARTPRVLKPLNGHTARDRTIKQLIERIKSLRVLSHEEEVMMRKVQAELDVKRLAWRWTAAENRQIDRLIERRARLGRPSPFKVNTEVRDMAASMGRTYMALHRQIERRRKLRKVNCSDANSKAMV